MIYIILSVVTLLLTLFLGIYIFLSGKKSPSNNSFAFLIFGGAFWIFANFMADVSESESANLFWSRATLIGASLIPYFFYKFSLFFPKPKVYKIRYDYLLLLFAVIFIILSPTKWNISRVYLENGKFQIATGFLYIPFTIYLLSSIGFGIFNLLKDHSRFQQIEKVQVRFVVTGILSAVIIGSSTNLLLPILGDSKLVGFGPYSIILFVVLTSYAIAKHHLFDLKVIASELFTAFLLITLFINIFNYENVGQLVVNAAIFAGALIFGIFLIKSVIKEIKMRTQLEEANVELRKLDRAKSEFISMASHQLRTPLSSIKGYVSMMLEGSWGKLKAKQKEKLENVFESNERLIKLVADLMDISKIELGKMTMEKKMVQIEATLESCCNELKDVAEKKGLKLYFEKPKKPLPQIEVDDFKIRQAVFNVLDNAIKYTKSGEIKISAQQKDGRILIAVKDTGEGLSNEEKTSIFSGFVRGSAGINLFTEGTGIGLHVARKFLEMHNGKIWAESEGKGKGSTFFIELPTGI